MEFMNSIWNLTSPFFTVIILAALIGWWIYHKYKTPASKARFAIVSVTTVAGCFYIYIKMISGSVFTDAANALLPLLRQLTGISSLPETISANDPWTTGIGILALVMTEATILYMTVHAIKHWDGPETVMVYGLEHQGYGNSVIELARAELVRIVRRRPDPPINSDLILIRPH